jgi:hypothetical protein
MVEEKHLEVILIVELVVILSTHAVLAANALMQRRIPLIFSKLSIGTIEFFGIY